MNKPDFDTMGLDDLYNNFKIVQQKVKKYVGTNNDDKNLAFLTTSGSSSTNNINTVNPEVSTGTTKVNTASTEFSTASFSDATIYAFLSTQPQGSQLVHEDLEQLHDDDLEEMDLKWNMALLSMRARKFYQRTGKKIIIDRSNTAGYDKSKVECFNCHKIGHFSRECKAPRSKDNRNWNQGSSSKAVKIEDASEKAICAIDGAGFDWSDMVEEEIQANMALMAFSRFYRSVCHKEYQMGLLMDELENVKQEKEGFDFKIAKFDKSAKDLKQQLASQITDKSKKGFGYNVVPSPHPLILNRPTPLDLSFPGLEEFNNLRIRVLSLGIQFKAYMGCDKESNNSKENTDDSLEQHQKTNTETSSVKSSLKVDKDWKEKFFCPANHVKEVELKKVRENNDAPIIEDWVLDDEDDDEPNPKVEKKTVIPTATKKEFVKPEKPVRELPAKVNKARVTMSSATSDVTYTSVYTDSEPGRAFWGADYEEISEGGIPRPLPPIDSPTTESPRYVTESDPEEDPEEYEDDETEDGPVDYPMDGGDDGDDDDGDSSGDDARDEDEDEEDEEDEREEH
ncbi:putative ribonuclease H-like domain-containing protein [Tanacetum coccineum]